MGGAWRAVVQVRVRMCVCVVWSCTHPRLICSCFVLRRRGCVVMLQGFVLDQVSQIKKALAAAPRVVITAALADPSLYLPSCSTDRCVCAAPPSPPLPLSLLSVHGSFSAQHSSLAAESLACGCLSPRLAVPDACLVYKECLAGGRRLSVFDMFEVRGPPCFPCAPAPVLCTRTLVHCPSATAFLAVVLTPCPSPPLSPPPPHPTPLRRSLWRRSTMQSCSPTSKRRRRRLGVHLRGGVPGVAVAGVGVRGAGAGAGASNVWPPPLPCRVGRIQGCRPGTCKPRGTSRWLAFCGPLPGSQTTLTEPCLTLTHGCRQHLVLCTVHVLCTTCPPPASLFPPNPPPPHFCKRGTQTPVHCAHTIPALAWALVQGVMK